MARTECRSYHLCLAGGVIQAISWDQVRGFTNWGQFFYYGSPWSRTAGMMQFLPRLVSSLIITFTYASLIRFLRRPDITAQCAPTAVARSSSALTLCNDCTPPAPKDGDNASAEVPPWEKLVLPDYSKLLEKEDDRTKSPTQRIRSRLGRPDRAWLRSSRFSQNDRSLSSLSDETLTASLRFGIKDSQTLAALEVPKPAKLARPLTAPSSMPFGQKQTTAEPLQARLSLPLAAEHGSRRSSAISSDRASFRGMLSDPFDHQKATYCGQPHRWSMTRAGLRAERMF